MTKQTIQTDDAPRAVGTYSQGKVANGLLFASGQIGLDPETMILRNSFSEQVVQIFENIRCLALAANTSIDKTVKLTVFLTDLKNFSELNELMETILEAPYPARSAVGVSELPKGAVVEIEAIIEV